jgi:Rho family protein
VDDVFEEATRASMLMREGVSASSGAYQRKRESGRVAKGDYDGDEVKSSWKCCVVT